ncbi:MAG TPA: hypothetical protein VF759_00225 [Allosphingosinicella sp.]|jgi:hypothetical protein
MTDLRSTSEPDDRPLSMGEAIDAGARKVTTGLVIAGAIIGLALYARPGPPRYEAMVEGDRIVRIDTRKGTIISCEGQQTCQLIVRSGQRLTRVKRTDAPPQPPKALPRPAAPNPPPAAPAAEK